MDLLFVPERVVDLLDQRTDGVRPGTEILCWLSDSLDGLRVNSRGCVDLADTLTRRMVIHDRQGLILRKILPELGAISDAIFVHCLLDEGNNAKHKLDLTVSFSYSIPSFPVHKLGFVGNDHQKL